MTLGKRFGHHVGVITLAGLLSSASAVWAQAGNVTALPSHSASGSEAKPSPGITMSTQAPPRKLASLLDDPASSAKIQVEDGKLSIQATNASLTEVIRQVAAQTGMQVEGNSRDQRVFGLYGPGSPPEVLSALLYDSGYNIMMVGRTADGAPRRLVLSARTTGTATAQSPVNQASRNDDEDETSDPPAEVAQPAPMQSPGMQPSPAAPAAPGQVRTPQQMLDELQRLHAGQQPQEVPRD